MEIVCKNCNTSHYLSDDRIPLETKIGKCKQCSAPITVLGKNALDSIELELTQSTPPEPEATKNCDFCGEKILAIAKKCRHCGSMLDGSHAANSQSAPPIPSSHPLKSVESEITTSQINSSDFKNKSSLNNNLLIAVSPERIEYNKIRLKYQDIAEKAAKDFSENWFENMDDLHDRASSVVGGYLNSAINEAICDLVAKGIQDIDEKAFFEKYLKISWEDDFSDIDDKYNAIVLKAEELDAYRTARRQNRGRFVGGGFGIEGAINGMAKAGAANLAVGVLHGTFNLGAKAVNIGINAVKKSQLFDDPYTKISLVNAAYWQVFLVHFAYIDAINERMPEKVISDWVSNEDKLKAERLFENVKKGRIANTEIQQILLEVLTLNPYDDTIYMYWMQTYGDDNNSLERTAEYFGVTTFVRDKKAIVAILAIEDELMTEDNRCSPELATKSLNYFIKLANQGNKKAQFHLGMIYMDGIGVPNDATQAISYYLKSAEQNFSNAQLTLGFCYENGYGVTKDESQALNWYKKADEQGNRFAKNALNQLKDKITARENTDKAIKAGFNKTVSNGRNIVYVILKFVIPPWFILGAVVSIFTEKFDFVTALITLLIMLSIAALSWKVAKKIKPDNSPTESINNDSTDINSPIPNKFPHLWHFLGTICTFLWWSIGWVLMYFFRDKNRYSKDSAAQALEYFHKANEENDAEAQYNLGLMYESGEGIVINKNQAMICYRKASEQGNINAQNALKELNLKQSSDVNDTDYLSRFKLAVDKLIKSFNL